MSRLEVFLRTPLLLLLAVPAAGLVVLAFHRFGGHGGRRRGERWALGLRLLEVALLALIASGLGAVTYTKDASLLVLVDRSQSMRESREEAARVQQELVEGAKAYASVQTMSFGAWPGDEANEGIEEGTDLAAALLAAEDALPAQGYRRIILLSDGVTTDGDTEAAAKALAARGVRVDAIPFETGKMAEEVELTGFSLPESVAQGQRFSASVNALSAAKAEGILRVWDGESVLYEEPTALLAGDNTLTLTLTAGAIGQHTLRVEWDGPDEVKGNNVQYGGLRVHAGARVLLVDGTGKESERLAELLEQAGIEVDVAAPSGLPQTVSGLCEYGLIVLMNLAVDDLPEGSDERLEEAVSRYGRSLLTTGGENTYIYGGMKDTPFEKILPVRMAVEEKESADPIALMMVVDVTDSMTRTSLGTPIEMARRGAIKCIEGLNANDYAGVITFSDDAELLVPMSPMDDKDAILSAVNGIQTVGPERLTRFTGALTLACEELKAFDKLERKHVLFITDGSPADDKSGFDAIVKEMKRNGITLSTIAVGKIVNVVKLLNHLSELGGGRCYYVENAYDLPDIMSTDTVLLQVEHLVKSPFVPQLGRRTFPIEDEGALTQLFGVVRTAAKGEASVGLLTEDGYPLYAVWDYGSGLAASFMSDLNGDWSRSWFANPRGQALILSMLQSLLPDALTGSGVSLTLHAGGIRGRLSVEAEMGEAKAVSATVHPPMGEAYQALLTPEDGRFAAEIPLRGTGLYQAELVWLDENGQALQSAETSFAHAWSAEYEALRNPDGVAALRSLCAVTGGALARGTQELLAEEPEETPTERDLTLPLAVITGMCLLLELVLRRGGLADLAAYWRKRKARDRRS